MQIILWFICACVCLIYGVPDISCVVLSYKSEYFCLCQKTIVTWYRFLFSFPNKVFALLTVFVC